jgi:hypothetical protein
VLIAWRKLRNEVFLLARAVPRRAQAGEAVPRKGRKSHQRLTWVAEREKGIGHQEPAFGVVYVTLAQHATLVTTSDHSTRAKQTQTTLTVGPSSCGRRQHLCHPSAASWLGTLLACFNPEGDAKRFANSLACNRGTPGIALCSATFSNLQHDDPIPFPERFTLQGPLLSNRSALLDYRIPSSMVISFTALSRLVPRLKLDQRSMSRGSRRNGSKYCRTIGMRAKGSRASILTTCG